MDSKVALVIQYNGTRFPRTVGLKGGKKVNFTKERTVLELDEYDALLLLRANSRLSPNAFQFTVTDVIRSEEEEQAAQDSAKPVKKPKGLRIKKQGGE